MGQQVDYVYIGALIFALPQLITFLYFTARGVLFVFENKRSVLIRTVLFGTVAGLAYFILDLLLSHAIVADAVQSTVKYFKVPPGANAFDPIVTATLTKVFEMTHTVSFLIGICISQSMASSKRSFLSPLGIFFNWWFLCGTFMWFRFCYPHVMLLSATRDLLGAGTVAWLVTANIAPLLVSHTLAFFVGGVALDAHRWMGLHKAPETAVVHHYVFPCVVLAGIPAFFVYAVRPLGVGLEVEFLLRTLATLPLVRASGENGGKQQSAAPLVAAAVATLLAMAYTTGTDVSLTRVAVEIDKLRARLPETVTVDLPLPWIVVGALTLALAVLLVTRKKEEPKPTLGDEVRFRIRDENRAKRTLGCPAGWYWLCDSDDLPPGKVMPAQAAGVDLAVFRGEDGKVGVLDAYCPHLGSHLGYGAVKGNCVACPFHAWCFDTDGKCTDIWYTDKPIPANAKAHSWPVIEWGARVLFYYHPRREQPSYYPPDMSMFDGMYVVKGLQREFRSHVCEIMENCSDPAHFEVLHSKVFLPIIGSLIPFHIRHEVTCSDDGDVLTFTDLPVMSLWGFSFGNIVKVHVTYVGLTVLIFRFTIRGLGSTVLVKTMSQLSPTVLTERDIWYVDYTIPRVFLNFFKLQARRGFEEDFVAWENKIWAKNPLVVSGDGNIMKRRRWIRRFFEDAAAPNEVSLDW